VRGGSVLAERWVLALPPLTEGNVELEPEERRGAGEVINVIFEVDGEATGAVFDAAARWTVASEGYGRGGTSSR